MKSIVRWFALLSVVLCLWGCQNTQKVQVQDTNGDGKLTCTLEIRCDTLLNHLEEMPEGKQELIPRDGMILDAVTLEFPSGDTVFDVFRQTLRQENIHFEYTDASIYGSVYIEGIGNLYEYDCGPQSGWMYSVNGVYPGLGCSAYTLSDGDVIVFTYTCNLGGDVGEEIAHGN